MDLAIVGSPERIDEAYVTLSKMLYRDGAVASAPWGFERYDVRRQAPTPPYERFDYDLFRPIPSTLRSDDRGFWAR